MIKTIGIETQTCQRNETKHLIIRRVVIYLRKAYKSIVLNENAMVLRSWHANFNGSK